MIGFIAFSKQAGTGRTDPFDSNLSSLCFVAQDAPPSKRRMDTAIGGGIGVHGPAPMSCLLVPWHFTGELGGQGSVGGCQALPS